MGLIVLVVIAALILLTSLYVAAEFAAVGVRRSRVRQLAQKGNALARRLLPYLEDPQRLDRYIAACQIGITLSSLLLGAYGQATLAQDLAPLFETWGSMQSPAAHSAASAVVLFVLTAFHVIFGELLPKSIALQYPEPVALYTFAPMRWSLALYSWFITALNGNGVLLLKLLGMPQAGHRHIHSPEELELLIAESRDGGLLELEEQQRLHQALRLSRRTARQLMMPRRAVVALEAQTPPEELLRLAAQSPYTRLPVYQDTLERIIGMVHTKEIAGFFAERGRAPAAQEVLQPLPSVPDSLSADRLLSVLRRERVRLAVVVDEFGGMEGLVALEDVLTELVGQIGDEFKEADPQPERLPDGRVRLPGSLPLDQAEAWTGAAWQGGADTVAGHLLEAAGRLLEVGERVEVDGVKVEVESLDGHTIAAVLVRPLPAPPPED
ncbi:MAG: HlyC/CorC family transporter [Candidatus Handelsmanbacteria bacterium]|nr:HlyC/CorC family transporter [Candidatus Handelsmanbacteria bacterium]